MRPRDAPLLPSKEEAGTPAARWQNPRAQLGMGLGEGGARPRDTEHEVGLIYSYVLLASLPEEIKGPPSHPHPLPSKQRLGHIFSVSAPHRVKVSKNGFMHYRSELFKYYVHNEF